MNILLIREREREEEGEGEEGSKKEEGVGRWEKKGE